MANYSFVVDSSFKPFELQELLQPFLLYKDVYEKSEEEYNELGKNANVFKDLAENLEDGSKAKEIYTNYANDLENWASDFNTNGLSMGNRRALTNLKRRYSGEIGRLEEAKKKMDEEETLRKNAAANGVSMLYANDDLSIDDFLGSKKPNLYAVSADKLRQRGMDFAKAASTRKYSFDDEGSTLGGYYRKWVAKNGYSDKDINDFIADVKSNPEFYQQVQNIMKEYGADDNLTGSNRDRAEKSIINGMIDGAVFSMNVTPMQDLGELTAQQRTQAALESERNAISRQQMLLNHQEQQASLAESKRQHDREYNLRVMDYNRQMKAYDDEMARSGWSKDSKGRYTIYDPKKNAVQKAALRQGAYNAVYTNTFNTAYKNKTGVDLGLGASGTKTTTPAEERKLQAFINGGGRTSNGTYLTYDTNGNKILRKETYKKGEYRPALFFKASNNKSSTFVEMNEPDWEPTAVERISYDDLSTNMKSKVKSFLRKEYDDLLNGVPDSKLDEVAKMMNVWRDHNLIFDDQFAITLPGTDATGIMNNNVGAFSYNYNNFLSKISKLKIDNDAQNYKPKSNSTKSKALPAGKGKNRT